ncbi:tyrosyl-tRNA synthetase, variant [Capsaspora owczarzaki ATCC 30864]|uniref:tyrosyl-tRNA synthetase, variant n=1 Tax=Capsaspora owczarzaki (strain ATCC 30864) TaxID=595528 RepID=UPI000352530D|nr:tyrosyl-tRNA synthetase, variant [Capsaspora owczarzaki ATCC 30864]|eukprot:XP_011270584.1 tyrosyl-tRNA synthetase, variant [Capsaspora owczarzaki ATCC 30864]
MVQQQKLTCLDLLQDAGTVEMSFPASIFAYDIPTTSQDGKPVVPWYVNFADSNVFGFYGGGLYAQDEMQVTEHPILGSVRQMLENLDLSKNPKMKALTMETQPTPILVENVQRRVVVDTFPSAAAPGGLYGNAFASASFETIVQATHVLNPPTMSNIIAIAAQGYGFGEYALPVINFSFLTAYTGFAAAVASSWLRLGKPADRKSFKVVINTGNWGCGAFGGNPTMMALIQFAAAQAAGVDELIYSTVMPSPAVNRAREIWNELVPTLRDKPVGAWLGAFEKLRLRWGVSNGT